MIYDLAMVMTERHWFAHHDLLALEVGEMKRRREPIPQIADASKSFFEMAAMHNRYVHLTKEGNYSAHVLTYWKYLVTKTWGKVDGC